MKRVNAIDADVSVDAGGALINVSWDCPYCDFPNTGMHFSSNGDAARGDFEIDCDCSACGKTVTVICRNPERF